MCPIEKTANILNPTVLCIYCMYTLLFYFMSPLGVKLCYLSPSSGRRSPQGKSNLLVDKTDGPKPSIKPKLAGSLEKNNEDKTHFYYFCGFLGHKVTNVLLHLIFKNFNHKLVRVRTNAIVKNPNPANVVQCTLYNVHTSN